GAVSNTEGYLEAADGGTLFLDEIAEIPPSLQVKILRAIQEKTFQKVGSTKEISVDLQFIAATNRDLQEAVDQGDFRQDLFYRLNVIRIDLPPLRERAEDIPLLLNHFLHEYCREYNRDIKGFSPEAIQALTSYNYPGNIRELRNIVERCVVLGSGSDYIPLSSLPAAMLQTSQSQFGTVKLSPDGMDLEEFIARLETDLIRQALQLSGNNKTRAAELLGLSFRSFRYRLEKYNLK
ncbi:MAG: sigma-54-dependent Fis family transcriptional regulator, partial [Deltaproteobacteria bacterium]|nr:sigma-54-dependent Fis family transcriptional regulator [Deltaproteobacteria bacterium]